jgi:hypothetical protein
MTRDRIDTGLAKKLGSQSLKYFTLNVGVVFGVPYEARITQTTSRDFSNIVTELSETDSFRSTRQTARTEPPSKIEDTHGTSAPLKRHVQ